MTNFKYILMAGTILSTSAMAEFPDLTNTRPVLQDAPIAHVFVPQGFDDNDNAQIVVEGSYPNSCYHVGHTSYSIDPATKEIKVNVKAYYSQKAFCLMVTVPFTEVISLGVLEKASYKIMVNNLADLQVSPMPIAAARSSAADDYVYAPISEVTLTNQSTIAVNGTFTNTCMKLNEIKTNEEPGNVIAVLPIATYKDDGSCKAQVVPFKAEVKFSPKNPGTYLIHVRSLNGQALNRVVDANI